MTKSTPSTSTTVNTNPVGQMQAGYLQPLYNNATYLSDVNAANPNGPVGQNYLSQIQSIAQNAADMTGWMGGALPANAGAATNAMLTGNFGQGGYAAGPQIGQLTGMGGNAVNAGNYFANQVGGSAAYTPTAVAPYASGLTNLAGQYGGLTGAGYGSYGALNSLAPGALNAGQMTAQSLYGLAPQGMSAGWPSEQQLMANSGMAISGNPVFSSGLMGAASGQYINPQSNPALAGTIQSATTPLVNQFMTATAPLTTSGFEAGGRYGSGAMTNAQGQNQYALGQGISNAISQIVNNSYNTGLNAMLGAGSTLGSTYNTGVANSNQALANAGQLGQSGVQLTGNLLQGGGAALNTGYGTAGNLYGAGAGALNSLGGTGLGGASSNYSNAGNLVLGGQNAQTQGLASAGGVANQGYSVGGALLGNAGNLANTGQISLGGLAQAAPSLADYPISQLSSAFNTNWLPAQNAAAIFGSPIGGNTTQQTTTPYYTNTGQQVMSGLTSAATIAALLKI